MYKAKHVYLYYLIYKEYLLEKKLEDDSSHILVEDLMYFVQNNISEEYRIELIEKVQNKN